MPKNKRDQYSQGPSLPVKAWHQLTSVRIILAVCGIALVVFGITQVMETSHFSIPTDWPPKIDWGSSTSSSESSAYSKRGAQVGSSTDSQRSTSKGSNESVPRVHFDGNGAESGDMSSVDVEIGQQFTLPSCGFTRAGYLFTHWTTNTRKGAGTIEYFPGDTYSIVGPVTFFANWTKATPLIRFSVKAEGEVIEGDFADFDESCNHCVLVVENESDTTLSFDAVFSYYSSSGTEKGKGYDQASAVAPGAFAILVGYNTYSASAASYSLTAAQPVGNQEPLDTAVKGSEVSATADSATIRLENTGAEEVRIYKTRCAMMDENGILYAGDAFANGTIAPGESIEAVFEPRSMFDYSAIHPVIPDFDKMQRAYFVDGHVGALN